MPLQPLPPEQWPIAGQATPQQDWYRYFASADQLMRSAPGLGGVFGSAADASAVGHTIDPALLMAGLLNRAGPAGAFSDATPSAAQIVAQIQKAIIGSARLIMILNFGGGLMTLTAGTGVTFIGTTTVAAGFARWYRVAVTSITPGAEAVTIHGLMTASL